MNRRELLESVLKDQHFTHWSMKEADQFLKTFMKTIMINVKKGNDVSLVGFGTFTKVKRAARDGINPQTGKKLKIKARTVPKFRAGSEFKELIR